MKARKRFLRKCRNGERGQTIIESLLCMILILGILMGLLQIFQIAIAKLLANYSAFRTVRSYIVGFDNYLVERSARVAAIGASGKMIFPDMDDYSSPQAQFAAEEFMIPYYISGDRWLEYEYWLGENEYNPAYYNPSVEPPSTYLRTSATAGDSGQASETVTFQDYPYAFFDMADRNRVWFQVGQSTDIHANTSLINHAADYLEEE